MASIKILKKIVYKERDTEIEIILSRRTKMSTTQKRVYTTERKKEAEKRRRLLEPKEENINGLASVIAVKITDQPMTEKKKKDREKTLSIIAWVNEVNKQRNEETRQYVNDWIQPWDWRFVTTTTLYKYIPFERPGINLSQAIDHIKQQLAQYGPPANRVTDSGENIPLWYMSNNKLRQAVYKASVRRREMLRTSS